MKLFALALAAWSLVGVWGAEAAVLYPYLDGVRTAAAAQLAAGPADAKTRSALNRTLRLIDAPGKATLAKDLKVVSVIGPTLMKTSVADSFYAPLNSAVGLYLARLMAAAELRATNIAALPSSQAQAAAQASLQSFNTLLAAINATSDTAQACKLLGRVAPRLAATDKLIAKASNQTSSTQSVNSQDSDSSDDGVSWIVISGSGTATGGDYGQSGGLRVVVAGGDNGWRYLISW